MKLSMAVSFEIPTINTFLTSESKSFTNVTFYIISFVVARSINNIKLHAQILVIFIVLLIDSIR